MNKGAMRPLNLYDWPNAMQMFRKAEKVRIAESATPTKTTETTDKEEKVENKKVKLDKEQRSERLAVGLVNLARKCHVSQEILLRSGRERPELIDGDRILKCPEGC